MNDTAVLHDPTLRASARALVASGSMPARGNENDTADAKNWRSAIARHYDGLNVGECPRRKRYYYRRLQRRLGHLIEPGSRVLEIGCGDGEMLARLKPSYGVGVDLCEKSIREAKRRFPLLRFLKMPGEHVDSLADTFDYIVLSQTVDEIYDLQRLFQTLQSVCHPRTRVIVIQCSRLWQPVLKTLEWLRLKPRTPDNNWVPTDEIKHLLSLGRFETISVSGQTVLPVPVPFLGEWFNRIAGNLPLLHHLGLNNIVIARSIDPHVLARSQPRSVSIIVPACNESGHIEPLLKRIPKMAERQQVIFVEGGSKDDTWEVIQRAVNSYDGPFDVSCMQQDGKGKGDAVRKGFAAATGDVLMILDADISVPPEELPAFYQAIASGQGEFINGSRLVYLMDRKAMRFLNLLANKTFGWVFTYLLSQRFRDTLCGTKVLSRQNYERIAANRSYFGDFDPFGDFDLLFGAARLKLKIIDVPVHYKARVYGTTNISRFRHGLLLLRMCWFAARKIKFT